jgi:O-antigen/teichoic acid export membrane protein
MPAFLAASVATAFFPALSAQNVHIPEVFARTANRALHLVVLVATPAAIGIAVLAGPFIQMLYGPEFEQAVPLMRILALHIPIVGMDIVLGTVVVAADRQRQWVIVGVIAALFNPLLNLAAIPLTEQAFGNGAIGAAVITVFTELILMIGALRLRPAGVLDPITSRTLVRIGAASLCMVPVLMVLHDLPLGVLVVVGVLTYGVASLALRTISLSELRSWARRSDAGQTEPVLDGELLAIRAPGDEVATVLTEVWPRPAASTMAHPPVAGPALPPPPPLGARVAAATSSDRL